MDDYEEDVELVLNDEGKWERRKRPYATVEVETEEDYGQLLEIVDLGKNAKKAIAALTELAQDAEQLHRWNVSQGVPQGYQGN